MTTSSNPILVPIIILCTFALFACGGGGTGTGPGTGRPDPVQPDPSQPMSVILPLPFGHGLTVGELTVEAGASDEHGNVVVSCPGGGAACVINVAADGSATYEADAGMPSVAYPFPARMTAAFNGLSEEDRNQAITDMARAMYRDAVSSTATDADPALNAGTTMSRYNREPDIFENDILDARYDGRSLDFDFIELLDDGEPTRDGATLSKLVESGILTARLVSPVPGSFNWKGIEFTGVDDQTFLHGVFYSDIEDNNDADYLVLGLLTDFADEDDPHRSGLEIAAFASGKDLFRVGDIEPLGGLATYQGHATGLFASKERDPAFRYFSANVSLVADLDDKEIWGIVNDFVTPGTTLSVPGQLTLEKGNIQTSGSGFFRSRTVGVINGELFRGEWGGHFFGNGGSSTGRPGSVAGVFDAGLRTDRREYLSGVFGAYYDGDAVTPPADIPPSPDAVDGFTSRVVADLNDLPGPVTDLVTHRLARVALRSPVTTAVGDLERVSRLTGITWNSGVTQSSRNSQVSAENVVVRDNIALNARYDGQDLVFEQKNIVFETPPYFSTEEEPAEPGYRVTRPAISDESWKTVEYFYITGTDGRFRQVFLSDVQDNQDGDYLALGFWSWAPDVDNLQAGGSIAAFASGNDPFEVRHIEAVQGRATYEGDAFGLYGAQGDTATPFRFFNAQVALTADFDGNEIWGIVTDGRDTATGAQIFEGLALEDADIQTADSAVFEDTVRGVVNGRYVQGRWGGQFYGNGLATPDIPVSNAESPGSVAGTFGARTEDGSESVTGVFGAHRQP